MISKYGQKNFTKQNTKAINCVPPEFASSSKSFFSRFSLPLHSKLYDHQVLYPNGLRVAHKSNAMPPNEENKLKSFDSIIRVNSISFPFTIRVNPKQKSKFRTQQKYLTCECEKLSSFPHNQ